MTLVLPQLDADSGLIPDEVKQRLEDLYSLDVLDSSSEERFSRYTELATNVLDAPFASAVLIDEDRLIFKAVSGQVGQEVDREHSFALHATAEEELLVVPDARQDARFAGHPLVSGKPFVRFYAGVAIRDPAGKALGTLCVMDTQPRSFSAQNRQILIQIGALLEHEIESRAKVAELRQQLREQVLLDASTQLPTEALFTARLARLLEQRDDAPVALTLIRLERFESVFSAVGRPGAAYLIRSAAQRLDAAISRECLFGKIREDTIAVAFRLLQGERPDPEVQRILDAFEFPFLLGNHTLAQTISIGTAIHPQDGRDSDTLLKRARTALNAVPASDSARFRRYRRSLSHEAARRFEIETALRGAIDRDELALVYQPKQVIATGRVAGAEALLRWKSPTLGMVRPDEFIPIAEDTGLIIQLGDWTLAAVCDQVAAWCREGLACPPVSVNLSGVQLRHQQFTDRLLAMLRSRAVDGSRIELEITEGTLIDSIEDAIAIMLELRELGISFSIDDFGKGFSSLSYLARMPVQTLKIDRSFIDRIPRDESAMTLVNSMITMAHGLGIGVVAEGVETQAQLEALSVAACDQVQGYLINPPRSAEEFALAYLRKPETNPTIEPKEA